MGPYQLWGFHVTVNSPFMAENMFWLAILGLLLFRHQTGLARVPDASTVSNFPGIYLAIALCAITLAFAHNLADPFLSDDYIILNGPPFHWQTFVAALYRPGGDGSFRPLGTLYYQLVKTAAGRDPFAWHLIGLGLHLIDSALVFALAWTLWRDQLTATVASLVFGLSGTRPEAALWTAGNCDLLACACVLGSICVALSQHIRSNALRLTASLSLVAAGILFKESAYAIPLIAFAIVPTRPNRSFLIGTCGVCAALLAWRWHLFNGPGGYVDPATGHPAILSLHLLTVAKAVFLRIWAVLLVPVDWDAPITWWAALAIAVSMAGLLALALGSRSPVPVRTRLCLIAATCCAVLPAIHLALIGQSAFGSRILYLAGAPFALLIGSLAPGSGKRVIVVCAVMVAGMAGVLEHNLNGWHQAALQTKTLCREASGSPPASFDGVPLFQNGFHECVEAARNPK